MGFMIKNPEKESGKSWPAIMIGLFVAFGGVLFGHVTFLDFKSQIRSQANMLKFQVRHWNHWWHSRNALLARRILYWTPKPQRTS